MKNNNSDLLTGVVDAIIFDSMKGKDGKIHIRIPEMTNTDFVEGTNFWIQFLNTDDTRIHFATVTYVRSGVMFFTTNFDTKEQHFQLGCVLQKFCDPEYFVADGYDSEKYIFEGNYDKTKVTYIAPQPASEEDQKNIDNIVRQLLSSK